MSVARKLSGNRTSCGLSCFQLEMLAQWTRQSFLSWHAFWLAAAALQQMWNCHGEAVCEPNNKSISRSFVGSMPAAFMYRPRRYLSTVIALGAARCCAFASAESHICVQVCVQYLYTMQDAQHAIYYGCEVHLPRL